MLLLSWGFDKRRKNNDSGKQYGIVYIEKLLSGGKKLLLNKYVELQIKKFKLSGKIPANYHKNISTEDNRKKLSTAKYAQKGI